MAFGFGSIQRRIARVTELAWRFALEDRHVPRLGQKLPDDVTLPSRAYVGVVRAARQMTLHGEAASDPVVHRLRAVSGFMSSTSSVAGFSTTIARRPRYAPRALEPFVFARQRVRETRKQAGTA